MGKISFFETREPIILFDGEIMVEIPSGTRLFIPKQLEYLQSLNPKSDDSEAGVRISPNPETMDSIDRFMKKVYGGLSFMDSTQYQIKIEEKRIELNGDHTYTVSAIPL